MNSPVDKTADQTSAEPQARTRRRRPQATADAGAKNASGARKRPRKGGVNPWVPNQHGAWPMLIIPVLMGLVWGWQLIFSSTAAEPSSADTGIALLIGVSILRTIALTVAWIVGYFAFFAWGLWIKIRKGTPRRAEAQKALLVYGSICAVAAVISLLMRPSLILWAVPLAPLVIAALYETWKHRPRSLLSGVSTTIASALLVPISVHAIAGISSDRAWWWAAVLAVYFSGTIFFVKTMIRERNNRRFWFVSMGYHALFTVGALAIAVYNAVGAGIPGADIVSGFAVAFAAAVTLYRSVAVPISRDKGKAWTPASVGKYESFVTLLVVVALLL